MAIVIGLLFAFLIADNVVLVDLVHDGNVNNSFTNQGYDELCKAAGLERTASGDCIETK